MIFFTFKYLPIFVIAACPQSFFEERFPTSGNDIFIPFCTDLPACMFHNRDHKQTEEKQV
jgi:hypothetical protein